jgi:hypothetical protein
LKTATPLENWIRDHEFCPVHELALLRRWGLGGLKWWKDNADSWGYLWDGPRGLWYRP